MYAGAGGDVVENDRDMHRVGQGGIMAQQAVTVAFVIVGRDNEQRVGPGGLGGFAFFDGVDGIVGAGTGDDLAGAVCRGDAVGDEGGLLPVAHCCGFAGRRADGNGADACLDLARQQGIK